MDMEDPAAWRSLQDSQLTIAASEENGDDLSIHDESERKS
jgi:hypothetical protein